MQIVRELIELREIDAARVMLRSTLALLMLRQDEPQRYLRLEHLLARPTWEASDAYLPGASKETVRRELASALSKQLVAVPPGRLLVLLSQALKWQQHAGLLPPGAKYDLFRGAVPLRKDIEDKPAVKPAGT